MKTLYVTDLDGTLLGTDAKLSPATIDMLNQAIEEGAEFSVATARTPATVSTIFKDVNLRHPMVVMTGAAIWDPVTDRYLATHFIPEQTVREILTLYNDRDFPTFIYTLRDHKIHIYHSGALNPYERVFMEERANTPFKEFHVAPDGTSVLPDRLDNVLLLYAMQPTEKGRPLNEVISARGDVTPMFYHDVYGEQVALMEVFPSEATKAAGVHALARELGATKVTAFGDNLNDLPMLRSADIAVAVGNAVGPVKEVADVIIGPNTSDSVPRAILDDMATGYLSGKSAYSPNT